MTRLLSVLFGLFGCVAIAIGLGIYLAGPDATAAFFDRLMVGLTGLRGYEGGLEHPNVNSEMRFFSVFWIAYGVALLVYARDPLEHENRLLVLMGLFFLGGVGRQLAQGAGGTPDLLFVALGWIELILPVLLGAGLIMARRQR